MSPIVCEEEDMAINLRAGLQERQCKCLSKSIMVKSVPSKRLYPELIYPPISALAPVSAPSTIAVGTIPDPDERLPSIGGTTYHEPMRPFPGLDHLNAESIKCLVSFPSCPKSSYIPSREEKAELMRQISSFTERKTPVQNMVVLFLAT